VEVKETNEPRVISRLPYAGCKLYFSGPGDQYAFLAGITEDSKPREIVALRDSMIDGLVKSGFSVVRDRNLPEYARPFDPSKVRYLIATCDGICCLCYPKTESSQPGQYRTSPMIIEEIKYALELNLDYIVVFVEETVHDAALEELLLENEERIQRRTISTSMLRNPTHLRGMLFQSWELIQPRDHSVFVAIPFEKNHDVIFDTIRQTIREICDLECRRSKDSAMGSAIEEIEVYRAIINKIQQSPFVVLVLNGNSPNCYFEAGVAAAFQRPAIRITSNASPIPFNIQHWSVIAMSANKDDQDEFKRELRKELSRFAREEVSYYNLDTYN